MAEQKALNLLCSSAKIERDKGVLELRNYLSSADDEATRLLEISVQKLLSDSQAPWETKHGGLMGTNALLLASDPHPCSDEFAETAQEYALKLLNDAESRVRLAAGEVMGVLCQRNGPAVYASIKDQILVGVQGNLERQPVLEPDSADRADADQLVEKLVGGERKRRNSADADQIFHETAGWKSLETWMKCLQSVIDGCGPGFNSFIDQELLDLIFQALNHTNRFVRETGYYVCGSLVNCNKIKDGEMVVSPEENAVYQNGRQFALQLRAGLADNWSQVRLASSVATRSFLLGLPGDEARQEFYIFLLPPICLNRYYVAAGVRIYNQDTWKMVTDGDGKHLVEQYITEVVEFYSSQTEADNHAVREAACACIAELGSKIDKDIVRPYVPKLLDCLLVCFKDESWPVRDASCVACGNFVLCFPEESRSTMEALFPLFYENLQDNIASVRQGASVALANVVKAYGKEALDPVMLKVKVGLEAVESQAANTDKYGNLDKGPATYGVVKRLRDNDADLHTDRQMYSCGSLAPKMHRGTRAGGCMDHMFRKPSEPWEMADGCINLLAELSQNPSASEAVGKMLALLARAASHQHYSQHVHLLETLCKRLPDVCLGLGKRAFKMYLELFFDAIFYSLSCDNALTSASAAQCLQQLSRTLGPNILKGRVEQFEPKYLSQLESSRVLEPAVGMGPPHARQEHLIGPAFGPDFGPGFQPGPAFLTSAGYGYGPEGVIGRPDLGPTGD